MVTPVVRAVARVLLAPSLVVAAAIIVKSYADVGDGFSAGVIVALAVALQYIALGWRGADVTLPILRRAPAAALAGLLLALAVGFAPALRGLPLFTHLPPAGSPPVRIGTLELTTAVVFDVGVFLLVVGALVTLVHHLARPGEGDAS
jgi:multisubunit Na+/H+ antiporter MnhB subunit